MDAATGAPVDVSAGAMPPDSDGEHSAHSHAALDAEASGTPPGNLPLPSGAHPEVLPPDVGASRSARIIPQAHVPANVPGVNIASSVTIGELKACDTFHQAMTLYASAVEAPPIWNDWQAVAYQVAREFEDVSAKIGSDSAWFAAKRKETMEARFGPQWRKGHFPEPGLRSYNAEPAGEPLRREGTPPLLQPRPKSVAQSGSPLDGMERQVRAPLLAVQADIAERQRGLGVVANAPLAGGYLHQAPRPQHEVARRSQSLSPAMLGNGAAERLGVLSDADLHAVSGNLSRSATPSNCPDGEAPSIEALLGLRFQNNMVETIVGEHGYDGNDSETTSNHDRRVAGMCQDLYSSGESENMAGFVAQVSVFQRRLKGRFGQERVAASEGGAECPESLKAWAAKKIDENLYLEEDGDFLRAHALLAALGGIAQVSAAYMKLLTKQLDAVLRQTVEIQEGQITPMRLEFPTPQASSGSQQRFEDAMKQRVESAERGAQSPGRGTPGAVSPELLYTPGMFEPLPQEAAARQSDATTKAMQAITAMVEDTRRRDDARDIEIQAKAAAGQVDQARHADKVNALTGIKFDLDIPVFKDTDTNFDRHWRQFEAVLACYAFGRLAVRPIDVIVLYKRALEAGSTRLLIYETMISRAQRKKRLPEEAAAVMEEIKERMKKSIRETEFQRQDRLDKEFEALEMGRRTHAEFRAQFELLRDELEDGGVMKDVGEYKRKYLSKITDDLRKAVLGRNWDLDGGEANARKPKTWEEVADCVEMELETQADVRAPREQLFMAATSFGNRQRQPKRAKGGGTTNEGGKRCDICNSDKHLRRECPRANNVRGASEADAVAQRRGEAGRVQATNERTGKHCNTCGSKSHTTEHHDQSVIQQHNDKMRAQQPQRHEVQPKKGNDAKGGKGGGKGKQGQPNTQDPDARWRPKADVQAKTPAANQKNPVDWNKPFNPYPGDPNDACGFCNWPGRWHNVKCPASYHCCQCGRHLKNHEPPGVYCKPFSKDKLHATRESGGGGEQRRGKRGGGAKGGEGGKGKKGKGKGKDAQRDRIQLAQGSGVENHYGLSDRETVFSTDIYSHLEAGGPGHSMENDLVCWASGCETVEELMQFTGENALDLLLWQAVSKGRIKECKVLDQRPVDDFTKVDNPRPAGYAAQTLLYFGGMAVVAMLDYCATCSAIPEELLMMIIRRCDEDLLKKKMKPSDQVYPIVALHRYVNAAHVNGVDRGGKASSDRDNGMEIRYAVALRAEFVRLNKYSGDKENPTATIYFKVLPKGRANVPGVLVGYPTLDDPPYGLGHARKEKTHFFSKLNVHLPRTELGRRREQQLQLASWKKSEQQVFPEEVHRVEETINLLRDGLLADAPCAILDAAPVFLQPGEQAIVPATWTNLSQREKDFYCCTPLELEKAWLVTPGVCDPTSMDCMLCVENNDVVEMQIDTGEVLAVGYEMPVNSVAWRRNGKGKGAYIEREQVAVIGEPQDAASDQGERAHGPGVTRSPLGATRSPEAGGTRADGEAKGVGQVRAEDLSGSEGAQGAQASDIAIVTPLTSAGETVLWSGDEPRCVACGVSASASLGIFRCERMKCVNWVCRRCDRGDECPEYLPDCGQHQQQTDRALEAGAAGGADDRLFHLVQDDDLILHIHEQELPPDEYYDELKKVLASQHPEVEPDLVNHIVALCAAFDTAAAFALSFGIKKFQLAQAQAKLVGEIVGRFGRSPNPDLCDTIRRWPPIKDLKDLQGFLGTTNYGRLHAGPAYARHLHPLRALLKKDAVWPMNAEQEAAVEVIKTLILEEHVLEVPNEREAIEAAHAWQNGLPATGFPYEGGADTSKIAVGGALGQARERGGKLHFLFYFSTGLTPAQSQMHPYEQELYGLLRVKQEVVKHFGRIPVVFHTDHGTITRLEHLPLERIDAKHYRWYAEITQGGDLLLYQPGTSQMHKVFDGLSRNPPRRDDLNLARIGDWAQIKASIRGVVKGIDTGEYDAEDPTPFLESDLDDQELVNPAQDLAQKGGREKAFRISESLFEFKSGKPHECLFLPPYALSRIVEEHSVVCSAAIASLAQRSGIMMRCEPPYSIDDPSYPQTYWIRLMERDQAKRRKLLRKQIFAGLVCVLSAVVKFRCSIIIGTEQGGLIALMACRSLVLEAACRARILTGKEMTAIREAWSGVVSIIAINPLITVNSSDEDALREAVPEFFFEQPRGQHRAILLSDKGGPMGKYQHQKFAHRIGKVLQVETLSLLPGGKVNEYDLRDGEELRRLLALPLPVYLEDDVDGLGSCVVCGKRGSFSRCAKCGLLAHVACLRLTGADATKEAECPRCCKLNLEVPDATTRTGIGRFKFQPFQKGLIAPPLVGLERGIDSRVPCPLDVRPTDAEAVKAGFQSGEEWYKFSAAGVLVDPRTVQANFDQLAGPPKAVDEPAGETPDLQWWRYLKGARTSPGGGPLLEMEAPRTADITALLAQDMGMVHPYLFVEVEPYLREWVSDLREDLSEVCRDLWRKDAEGDDDKAIALPPKPPRPDEATWPARGKEDVVVQIGTVRDDLRKAQRQDPKLSQIIDSKEKALDPAYKRPRKTGQQRLKEQLPVPKESYRLAFDGILEFQQIFSFAVLWLPVIPKGDLPFDGGLGAGPVTWRYWLFDHAHKRGVLAEHRPANETYQHLRRMAYWESLSTDCDRFYRDCMVCLKYRSHPVQGPWRSILADDARAIVLPWQDVVVDMQGPFTRAEGGEQYCMAYHCTRLRVPFLEVTRNLQAGYVSRALVNCVFKARGVPDIYRTDGGPEFTSRVNKEMMAICNAKHVKGAALTPRHQGIGERGHQTMVTNLLILMQEVVKAFPQEWAALVPAVEYLMHTAPQGAHGLSAHDISVSYGIASRTDVRLAPFLVPKGLPETDVAAKLFTNFRELYGIFTRAMTQEAFKVQLKENSHRPGRTFEKGEVVFRRMPLKGRLPKHMLPPPSLGPYVVVRQPTTTSVVLADAEAGTLIDGGAYIPIDQILAGPRRAPLEMIPEEESEVRPLSQMIAGEKRVAGPLRRGYYASQKRGWGSLTGGCYVAYMTALNGPEARKLTIGKVLTNNRKDLTLLLQPFAGVWKQVRVVHLPLYQAAEGYTIQAGPNILRETVRFEALVAEVELLTGGELMQGSARRLSDGGWGLLIYEQQEVAAKADAEGIDTLREFLASVEDMEIGLVGPDPVPPAVATNLGTNLETIMTSAKGRLVALEQSALVALRFGERIAFLEIFCGRMLLTLGVRAIGMKAVDGWDSLYPMGDKKWDFSVVSDQDRAIELIDWLDPVIVHAAVPCGQLSQMAQKPHQKYFSQEKKDRAIVLATFAVTVIERRCRMGGGGSIENPRGSELWRLSAIVAFFGTVDAPKEGRFFGRPDLCAYDAREPGRSSGDELFYRKAVVLAATYSEILEVNDKCPGNHEHQVIRGSVKDPQAGKWVSRGVVSGTYSLDLGLRWGYWIGRAALRLAQASGSEWAQREMKRQDQRDLWQRDRWARQQVFGEVQPPRRSPTRTLRPWSDGSWEGVAVFRETALGQAVNCATGCHESIYSLPAPVQDVESPPPPPKAKGVSLGQGVKNVEGAEVAQPEPVRLRESTREEAVKAGAASWSKPGFGEVMSVGQQAWMDRLKEGDLSGVVTPDDVFIPLAGEPQNVPNPRMEEAYRQRCLDACGLGEVPDAQRYAHLSAPGIALLRWLVKRSSSCMWLPDSRRTMARGFRHRLVTRGPPVRVPLHRLNRPDMEWCETAVKENVDRGQLIKGNSLWGFPAFPTKEGPDHKATKRARRMVVDYRALNRVTVRKVFIIPNSDALKSNVAGSRYISVGDLKEGFNQCRNELETSKKMAVLVSSGCYLPVGLTFGPTNGPEDFQELVFIVFSRRLHREWYMFIDDLCVATGRPVCFPPGPSRAHDVMTPSLERPRTPGEEAQRCASRRAGQGETSSSGNGTFPLQAAGGADGSRRTSPRRSRTRVKAPCGLRRILLVVLVSSCLYFKAVASSVCSCMHAGSSPHDLALRELAPQRVALFEAIEPSSPCQKEAGMSGDKVPPKKDREPPDKAEDETPPKKAKAKGGPATGPIVSAYNQSVERREEGWQKTWNVAARAMRAAKAAAKAVAAGLPGVAKAAASSGSVHNPSPSVPQGVGTPFKGVVPRAALDPAKAGGKREGGDNSGDVMVQKARRGEGKGAEGVQRTPPPAPPKSSPKGQGKMQNPDYPCSQPATEAETANEGRMDPNFDWPGYHSGKSYYDSQGQDPEAVAPVASVAAAPVEPSSASAVTPAEGVGYQYMYCPSCSKPWERVVSLDPPVCPVCKTLSRVSKEFSADARSLSASITGAHAQGGEMWALNLAQSEAASRASEVGAESGKEMTKKERNEAELQRQEREQRVRAFQAGQEPVLPPGPVRPPTPPPPGARPPAPLVPLADAAGGPVPAQDQLRYSCSKCSAVWFGVSAWCPQQGCVNRGRVIRDILTAGQPPREQHGWPAAPGVRWDWECRVRCDRCEPSGLRPCCRGYAHARPLPRMQTGGADHICTVCADKIPEAAQQWVQQDLGSPLQGKASSQPAQEAAAQVPSQPKASSQPAQEVAAQQPSQPVQEVAAGDRAAGAERAQAEFEAVAAAAAAQEAAVANSRKVAAAFEAARRRQIAEQGQALPPPEPLGGSPSGDVGNLGAQMGNAAWAEYFNQNQDWQGRSRRTRSDHQAGSRGRRHSGRRGRQRSGGAAARATSSDQGAWQPWGRVPEKEKTRYYMKPRFCPRTGKCLDVWQTEDEVKAEQKDLPGGGKHIPCRNFALNGKCPKGDHEGCSNEGAKGVAWYSHDRKCPTPICRDFQSSWNPNVRGTPSCRHGDRCNLVHAIGHAPNTSEPNDVSNYPGIWNPSFMGTSAGQGDEEDAWGPWRGRRASASAAGALPRPAALPLPLAAGACKARLPVAVPPRQIEDADEVPAEMAVRQRGVHSLEAAYPCSAGPCPYPTWMVPTKSMQRAKCPTGTAGFPSRGCAGKASRRVPGTM